MDEKILDDENFNTCNSTEMISDFKSLLIQGFSLIPLIYHLISINNRSLFYKAS